MANTPQDWMRQAVRLAVENAHSGLGGPFGALIVRNGELIATGVNLVTSTLDPTAHAEVVAIRKACEQLRSFQLTGCELYTSCEPCPMCLGAMYWARTERYYFACSREDAKSCGFDDAFIYDELPRKPEERSLPGECILCEDGLLPFAKWRESGAKTPY